MYRHLTIAALCVALAPTALGQVTTLYYSKDAKLNAPMPQNCVDAGKVFSSLIQKYPQPDKWRFIIACDLPSWDDLMAKSGHAFAGRDIYGATSLDNSTTLIRGSALLSSSDREDDITPDEIVAHELAHIKLHTSVERPVRLLTEDWLRDQHITAVLH